MSSYKLGSESVGSDSTAGFHQTLYVSYLLFKIRVLTQLTGKKGAGTSAISLRMVHILARGGTWVPVKVIAGCCGPGKDAAMGDKD